MAGSVTDTDKGYAKLIKQLRDLEAPGVYVGVRAAAGSDMVIIAASNEFGTSDGHVPERSYLRSTVDDGQSEIADDLQKACTEAVDGTRDLRTGLERVGAKWVGRVQEKIRSHPPPPNAPSTIAKKHGADASLVDTGRLRQSIDYELRDE